VFQIDLFSRTVISCISIILSIVISSRSIWVYTTFISPFSFHLLTFPTFKDLQNRSRKRNITAISLMHCKFFPLSRCYCKQIGLQLSNNSIAAGSLFNFYFHLGIPVALSFMVTMAPLWFLPIIVSISSSQRRFKSTILDSLQSIFCYSRHLRVFFLLLFSIPFPSCS
jgi:hypothetical protein